MNRAWEGQTTVVGTYGLDDLSSDAGLTVRKRIVIPLKSRAGAFALMEFQAERVDYPKDRLSKLVAHLATQIGIARDRDDALQALRESEDRAITDAIIAMGKTLGVSIVAEGIENENQGTLLRELQCNELQGFLYGKPGHPDELVTSLGQTPGF